MLVILETYMTTNRLRNLASILTIVAALSVSTVIAQQDVSPAGKQLSELWDDFLHYIKIGRPELSRSFGQAILDSGAKGREIYLLQVNTRNSADVLGRGARLEGMKEIIANLQKMIDAGYEDLRSDPAEIAHSIEKLGGTMRSYGIAKERLMTSDEYALPQLLQKLMDPKIPLVLWERIVILLPQMGKGAVRPLTVALQSSDPKLQEVIASALGEIQYPHAAARLKELSERAGILPRTKAAAQRALIACAGQAAPNKSVAELYYQQGLNYYYQRESISPDPNYPTANVWYWKANLGLTYTVLPTEIFCDVYAMRMARLALKHDENFYPAVSLWIAANLKRIADLPENEVDQTYGEQTPSPKYFALASSARYLQDVLGRALQDRNSAVAIGAIEALAKTAGAKNLVEPVSGGAQPLVEALSYPDRRVRFLAALSLANALPTRRFVGDELVVSQLIEALRQTGQKTALVIVADQQRSNSLKDTIRSAGYQVIGDSTPDGAIAAAHVAGGVEVAVLADKPNPIYVITRLREDPAFVTLPVVVSGITETLRRFAETDTRTTLIDVSADTDAIIAAIDKAVKGTAGVEMTIQEAGDWTILAANAIRQLGQTGNTVFKILRAESSLVSVLDHARDDVRLSGAAGLAVMRSATAQQAIGRLAVSSDVPEDIRIKAFGYLSDSLRRFGNQLTEELSQAVLDIVTGEGSPELLNAAAQSLGAMNLPSEKIKSLILQTVN